MVSESKVLRVLGSELTICNWFFFYSNLGCLFMWVLFTLDFPCESKVHMRGSVTSAWYAMVVCKAAIHKLKLLVEVVFSDTFFYQLKKFHCGLQINEHRNYLVTIFMWNCWIICNLIMYWKAHDHEDISVEFGWCSEQFAWRRELFINHTSIMGSHYHTPTLPFFRCTESLGYCRYSFPFCLHHLEISFYLYI